MAQLEGCALDRERQAPTIVQTYEISRICMGLEKLDRVWRPGKEQEHDENKSICISVLEKGVWARKTNHKDKKGTAGLDSLYIVEHSKS